MLDFIVVQVFNFIQSVISLFPVGVGFPTAFHTAVAGLGGYLRILDPLIPINTLLSCILFIFGVELVIFGFKTLKWIMGHVPIFGGRGH